LASPSGEIGMTSLPVIAKRPIYPKPLEIGVSFLLTTNRNSLVGFQNMRSDFKFGAPSGEFGTTSLPVVEKKLNNKNCLGNKTENINVKNCKFKTQCKSH